MSIRRRSAQEDLEIIDAAEKARAEVIGYSDLKDLEDRTCGCGSPLSDKPRSHCRHKTSHACGARHGPGVERCDKPRWRCLLERKAEREARFAEDPTSVTPTAEHMAAALRRHYRQDQFMWATFEEFRVGIGKQHDVIGTEPSHDDVVWERRIDFLAISTWPKRGPQIIAHEIKTDRGDLRNELKNPDKRAAAQSFATHFNLVTPIGLCKPNEIPDDCGLLEVEYRKRWGPKIHIVKEAPDFGTDALTIHWRTFGSLAQRAAEIQASRPL